MLKSAYPLDREAATSLGHRLTFYGHGRSLAGRCSCGTAFLQNLGPATPRQQIDRQFARHVENAKCCATMNAP
jgi:hypothetical protein